jgi:predicted Zn-ribbon and HTH transcriptional regulator
MEIKAECKVCMNSVPVDQFKLHHEYKKMVCPTCFTGKTKQKLEREKEIQKKEVVKPVGWDAEDDYLEKMAQLKREENQAQFNKIPGTNQVRCQCNTCRYDFKYDPFRKLPSSCPYCNADIPRLKAFNLL